MMSIAFSMDDSANLILYFFSKSKQSFAGYCLYLSVYHHAVTIDIMWGIWINGKRVVVCWGEMPFPISAH